MLNVRRVDRSARVGADGAAARDPTADESRGAVRTMETTVRESRGHPLGTIETAGRFLNVRGGYMIVRVGADRAAEWGSHR